MSSKQIISEKKLKPFFQSENASVYKGDCLEIMQSLPEASVDMVFADPPYNLSNDGFTVHAGKRVSVNKGKWDKSFGPEKDFEFHFKWIEACKRVLKDNGTIWISGTYHSIYACGYALQIQNFRFLNDISWFKPNASPNLSCRMFTASHETLIWASKSKKTKHIFNYSEMKNGNFPGDKIKNPGKQMRSVWSITTPASSEKIYGKHPTQKPLALLDRVVIASTNPGQVILDPFCGSATTGVSALLNSRKFIGIDMDEEYLSKLAIPRLKDALKMSKSRLL
jgi:site-specific DNA-methyltransferase (adenine-specific)